MPATMEQVHNEGGHQDHKRQRCPLCRAGAAPTEPASPSVGWGKDGFFTAADGTRHVVWPPEGELLSSRIGETEAR